MVNILTMNMPRKSFKTPSEFKVLIGKAKVDHDGLGVTNVQITSALNEPRKRQKKRPLLSMKYLEILVTFFPDSGSLQWFTIVG